MLSFEEFSRALQDAVERLHPVTLEQLAAEGVSVRREDVPRRFRVSFGKTFRIDVASWLRPRNAGELARCVRAAELLGRSIKPIGSLCTWSPAACPDPDGIALLTDGLDKTSDPEWPLLREKAPAPPTVEARSNAEVRDARHLIRVEAGSTLWALNEALAARGLGLKTLGGYGGERVGGALSTGTHGSSIFSGPICDFVRSLDVVWRGVMVRLEPRDGPTDPEAFAASPAHAGWLLWQNDEAFHTARISYGTFGVAYSYLIEVAPTYYLEERRAPVALSVARDEIRAVLSRAAETVFQRAWSSEFYFNLFAKTDAPLATRVMRVIVAKPEGPVRPRNTLDDKVFRTLRAIGIDPGRFFSFFFRLFPSFVPTALAFTIKQLNETYINRADHVYNMGSVNLVGTLVQETAVPAERFEAYLEDCFALARRLFEDGKRSLTSPIGVRFVKPSAAPLAVQGTHWTDADGTRRPATLWAMVNYTLTVGTAHSDEIMRAFAEVGARHCGRAHPGKYCFDSHAQWAERCDLPAVLKLRALADPRGVFLNAWNRELFARR
jgi:FAD/FMN-containing dehydrogenase